MSDARPYIFMNLWGRCGAIFFHSLFDNHPDLSTIPGIAPYNLLAQYAHKPPPSRDPAFVANWIAKIFHHYYNSDFFRNDTGLDKLGPNGDEAAFVDIGAFEAYAREDLQRSGDISMFGVSEAMHNAFDRCLGRAAPLPMVFLQLHKMNLDFCPSIVTALPKRKGVLLTRAPIDTAESNLNYMFARPPVQRSRLSKMYAITLGMLEFQYGPAFLDERAIVVRLEDVKKAPEDFLRQLCGFFGLRYDSCLLETTQVGKAWQRPPSQRNPEIKGFEAPSAKPQGYRLTDRDRSLFAVLYDGMRRFMDYAPEADQASPKDVVGILRGESFDWEIDLAEKIGIDPATLPQQPDYIGFRRSLAQHMSLPNWQKSNLRSQRLILA